MNTHFNPRTRPHIVELAIIELAVIRKFAHPVVDITIVCRVGKAFFNQRFNHCYDIADMPRGTRLVTWRQDVEASFVLMHGIDHTLGQRGDTFTILIGTLENLIVDIGNIAHVINVITTFTQIACDHVKGDHDAGVT